MNWNYLKLTRKVYLLMRFCNSGMWYIRCFWRKYIDVNTQNWVNHAKILTCYAISIYWCNIGLAIMGRTNCFCIGFETFSMSSISCLILKTYSKFHVLEVMGPGEEYTIFILVSGPDKSLTSILKGVEETIWGLKDSTEEMGQSANKYEIWSIPGGSSSWYSPKVLLAPFIPVSLDLFQSECSLTSWTPILLLLPEKYAHWYWNCP